MMRIVGRRARPSGHLLYQSDQSSKSSSRARSCGALVALLTACSPNAEGNALPPSPPVVVVTMEDYRFKHPSNVPAGRVVFQVNNAGEVNHRLTLLPLAEEVPPIDEQLRDQIPQAVAPLAGVPEIEPGDSGTFAVELEADTRYAIVCFIEDDDGSHALKGESSEFRTSEQT